ncbi:unnamed protein product, partial [Prorocentrum cordatum]
AVHAAHGPAGAPDTYGWFEDLGAVWQRLTPAQRARSVDFVAAAGDVVWVPTGWWHAVMNLSSWTVGITENCVPIFDSGERPRIARGTWEALAERLEDEQLQSIFRALRGTPDEVLLPARGRGQDAHPRHPGRLVRHPH